MNIKDGILGLVPEVHRNVLFCEFEKIINNYREKKWEPSELNGGKLCEVIYSILKGYIDGRFPGKPAKPKNMYDACKEFENADSNKFPRSIRIQIPRMIIALYEIRNNRGVGHVGGDVDPNEMDATAVLYMSKWLLAELIRVFHKVSIDEAQEIVGSITEKIYPEIWEIDGKRRVLNNALDKATQTLLVLYGNQMSVKETDLIEWVEHTNPSVYRRDVLRKLHKSRMIEYNEKERLVTISPKGIQKIEKDIFEKKI